jgi:hypothetical protein
MVEVRARSNRSLIGAFQCAVGGIVPTSAPFIAQPTLAPTAPPTLVPSATSQPDVVPTPTTVSDFTPEPTEVLNGTSEPTPTELGVAPQGVDCPPGYPIKGTIATGGNNNGEKIYHVPGDSGYDAAIPERCFSGTIEAEAAGYHLA